MSLEQVQAFYDLLTKDQGIYDEYYNKCCCRGFFGIWNWDKTKIISFAASLGYNFTESELDQIWFENDAIVTDSSVNSSEYGSLSHAAIGF